MNTSTAGKRNGIQWTLWTQLEDLDFADDLALLSHTQQQMQEKTNAVATGDHLCTDWTEHPQGEDKGPESECGQQSPHQVGRAGPGRSK
jgi:hypothetical protein